MEIRKETALALFGGVNQLAEALGITTEAVYQWPKERPIPEAQALRIRYQIRPEAWRKSGQVDRRYFKTSAK